MRKSRQETASTRARIVEAAAGVFRRNGLTASGLNDLMAAAGLTHGGFYKHFASKDQLIAEAVSSASRQLTENITGVLEQNAGAGRGEAITSAYLSAAHRDGPDNGCPLAALGSEIARADDAARTIATESFLRFVGLIGDQSSESSSDAARQRATVDACTMIGALTVSRVVNDPVLSDKILEFAIRSLARRGQDSAPAQTKRGLGDESRRLIDRKGRKSTADMS